jgi:hypothetical protein
MTVLRQPRMLCVVFSDGTMILRHISSSNMEFIGGWTGSERTYIHENLLADLAGSQSMKLTDAKFSYVNVDSGRGEDLSDLIIGIAYQTEGI